MAKRPDLPKLAQDQMTTAHLDQQIVKKTQTTAHLDAAAAAKADAAKATSTETKPADNPSK